MLTEKILNYPNSIFFPVKLLTEHFITINHVNVYTILAVLLPNKKNEIKINAVLFSQAFNIEYNKLWGIIEDLDDYFYITSKAKNKDNSPDCLTIKITKIENLNLAHILYNNPHGIPFALLQSFYNLRMTNKWPLNKTTWKKINDVLFECEENCFDPVFCFEQMVAWEWKTIKLEYFLITPQ